MSADLAQLEKHLSTRSYVEGLVHISSFAWKDDLSMVRVSKRRIKTSPPKACRNHIDELISLSLIINFKRGCWFKFPFYRYEPSQADVHVFESLKTVPTGEFPHAARWYTHIKSWEAEHSSLAGSSEAGKVFTSGKAAAAPAPAQDDDEDDVDLFGEDEEEDEETKRIHEERVAAYNAKKAGKTKPAAKVRRALLPHSLK